MDDLVLFAFQEVFFFVLVCLQTLSFVLRLWRSQA